MHTAIAYFAKHVLYPTVQKFFVFRRRGYVGTTSRDTVYNHGLTNTHWLNHGYTLCRVMLFRRSGYVK